MWAPIAAVLLAVGTYHTPSMITAEQAYLKQHPSVHVQDIQASNVGTKVWTVAALD